jgi:hypothetical protein
VEFAATVGCFAPFTQSSLDCSHSPWLTVNDVPGGTATVLDPDGIEKTPKDSGPGSHSVRTMGYVETMVTSIITLLRAVQLEMVFRPSYLVRQTASLRCRAPGTLLFPPEANGSYFRSLVSDLERRMWFRSNTCRELKYALDRKMHYATIDAPTHAAGVSDIVASAALRRLEWETARFIDDTRCLQKLRGHIAEALHSDSVLHDCVLSLMDPPVELGCPQLPVFLPCVPREWEGASEPLRLQKTNFRLFFLCSYSKLPLPCGPCGAGHNITVDAASVHKLAPVVRISLLVLSRALKRQRRDALPIFFDAKLSSKVLQLQYHDAVLDLWTQPLSGYCSPPDCSPPASP